MTRSSSRTGARFLDGKLDPQTRANDTSERPARLFRALQGRSTELPARSRHDIRRLGASRSHSLNPMREARSWRRRFELARRKTNDSAVRSEGRGSMEIEPDAWEPDRDGACGATRDVRRRSILVNAPRGAAPKAACKGSQSAAAMPQGITRMRRHERDLSKLAVRIATPSPPSPGATHEGRGSETYDETNMRDR